MHIDLLQKNVAIHPTLRAYAERKITHLERFFQGILEAKLEFDDQPKVHSGPNKYRAELSLAVPDALLYADAVGETLEAALDAVVEKIKRQLTDYADKRQDHR